MLCLELDPEPDSPRLARHRVRRLLSELGIAGRVVDDVELLVTELVTNAVLHARTSLTLEVDVQRDRIEVAVTDHSDREVEQRSPSPHSSTGRGINILDTLAPDWSVSHHYDGKTIRFSLLAGQLLENVT